MSFLFLICIDGRYEEERTFELKNKRSTCYERKR
jgi:hypothetical protein